LLFCFGPLAVERRDQIAIGPHRPVWLSPRRSARAFYDVGLFVLQALEKSPPLGIDRGWVGFVFGVEAFDIGGISAIEERRVGQDGFGVLAAHGLILAGPEKRISPRPKSGRSVRCGCCNSIYDVRKSTKDLALNQDFRTSTSFLPILAGDGDTLIPADSIAAILDSASPLPPEMMAPAWPMRRPGGAVRPAMNPTMGFLRPRFASSFRNCAASPSADPPISPIMTIDSVFGSARNISSTAINSVPFTGSPPIPTAVV